MSASRPLRIGILGAARIAPMAIVRPSAVLEEVQVMAVAARDPARGRAFAAKHGIPRAHEDYAQLLADPELDAIYNPLPNGLHCEWTLRALEVGKHVLCEKPMAANAAEAERMAECAARNRRMLIEAFHWRHHPLAARIREILHSGVLGNVRHVEAHMCIPLPLPRDIRYRYELGGGATMDTGCYAINLVRFLAGSEPEVERAEARLIYPQVDRCMQADLRFPGGVTGRITCSLLSASLLRVSCRVRGEGGDLRVFNPVVPHLYHRLTLRKRKGVSRERISGEATYTCQLRAFVAHVRTGKAMETDAADAIANMRVIDAVYRKAGLQVRGG